MINSNMKPSVQDSRFIDEAQLFLRIASIIEDRKLNAAVYGNREITLMYWEVGKLVNSVILGFKRADYGKNILTALSSKLVSAYGNSFSEANLYRKLNLSEKSEIYITEHKNVLSVEKCYPMEEVKRTSITSSNQTRMTEMKMSELFNYFVSGSCRPFVNMHNWHWSEISPC